MPSSAHISRKGNFGGFAATPIGAPSGETLAERFYALAVSRSDPNGRPIGERLIGTSLHNLGDLPSARCHLECALVPGEHDDAHETEEHAKEHAGEPDQGGPHEPERATLACSAGVHAW